MTIKKYNKIMRAINLWFYVYGYGNKEREKVDIKNIEINDDVVRVVFTYEDAQKEIAISLSVAEDMLKCNKEINKWRMVTKSW